MTRIEELAYQLVRRLYDESAFNANISEFVELMSALEEAGYKIDAEYDYDDVECHCKNPNFKHGRCINCGLL